MSSPLVFLHGFLGCKEDWTDVISHLKDHFCCYAIDLPGHGPLPVTEDIVQSVFETLQRLKLLRCPIVGYSMGGRIALELAKRYPKEFEKLIVISSHTGLKDEASRQLRWEQDLKW